ncbi:MAG: DUF6491 family protein [Pseudomonadota bacterium]
MWKGGSSISRVAVRVNAVVIRRDNNVLQKHIFITLTSTILLACTTPDSAQNRVAGGGAPDVSDCISVASVRDYRVLDDANLLVAADHQRHYQVSLTRPARGLRYADRLRLVGRGGRVCSGLGEVVVRDGVMTESIRVDTVFRIAGSHSESLDKRRGATGRAAKQTQTPQPEAPGAEVEELD